jgi:hypothetical protein
MSHHGNIGKIDDMTKTSDGTVAASLDLKKDEAYGSWFSLAFH